MLALSFWPGFLQLQLYPHGRWHDTHILSFCHFSVKFSNVLYFLWDLVLIYRRSLDIRNLCSCWVLSYMLYITWMYVQYLFSVMLSLHAFLLYSVVTYLNCWSICIWGWENISKAQWWNEKFSYVYMHHKNSSWKKLIFYAV